MQSRTLGAVVLTLLALSLAPVACSSGNVAPPVNIRTEGGVFVPPSLPTDASVSDATGDATPTIDAADAADGAAPNACENKVKDGEETDVDCGGSRCLKCDDGKNCIGDGDCASKSCDPGKKCVISSCVDGIKNGTETDVDCGGICKKCGLGRACNTKDDCSDSRECEGTPKYCNCPLRMFPATKSGGGAYCVNETEITNEDYNAFITANISVGLQGPDCTGNTTFIPNGAWPVPFESKCAPVRHVDWCDATAYCKWKGRSLCGNMMGGSGNITNSTNPAQDAWYNACSAQGTNLYAYGNAFRSQACWVDNASSGPVSVTRIPATATTACETIPSTEETTFSSRYRTCFGGFTGLFHMNGNVAEWTNVCNATGGCLVRGGSFRSIPSPPPGPDIKSSCLAEETVGKLTGRDDIGFRCCLY